MGVDVGPVFNSSMNVETLEHGHSLHTSSSMSFDDDGKPKRSGIFTHTYTQIYIFALTYIFILYLLTSLILYF